MFERFTDQARRAVVLAQEAAREVRASSIGEVHVLLALVRLDGSPVQELLAAHGITDDSLVAVIEPPDDGQPRGQLPFTPECRLALERAGGVSATPGGVIGTPQLLSGLLGQPSDGFRSVLQRAGRNVAADLPVLESKARLLPPDDEGPGDMGETSAPATTPLRSVRVSTGTAARTGVSAGFFGPPAAGQVWLARCSFCGGTGSKIGSLVSGDGGTSICAACVKAATTLLDGEREPPAHRPRPRLWLLDPHALRPVPGMTEAEARAAEVAIRDVVARLLDRSADGRDAVAVHHGQGLGASVAEALKRYPQARDARCTAVGIELLTPQRARVAVDVDVPDLARFPVEGEATDVGGTWRLDRSVLRDVLARGGILLPDDGDA